MTNSHFARLVGAALFIVLVVCGPAHKGWAAANIVVAGETETSLTMLFTSAAGAQATIQFSRDNSAGFWKAPAQQQQGVVPGVTFGNTGLTFASPSRLREFGISPDQALHTFTSGIASRTHDDITIIQLFEAGEMAIALWREGEITEIWYVGEFVEEVLIAFPPHVPQINTVCNRLKDLCCKTEPPPTAEPPLPCPQQIPKPFVSGCVAAAKHCRAQIADAACDCLFDACNFCEVSPACCEAIPGLEEQLGAACVAWIEHEWCNPPPPPPPPPPGQDPGVEDATALLGEVVNRLQAIVDSRPQS